MILDSDSIDTLPSDAAMSPVEVADDDVIFDRRRSLELRSEPPSSLPGIIEEEEPPLMGEEDLCDVVESVTFSSMSVSNGSAATSEPKADLACLSTPVSASDVVTEQTLCYPTDIDVPPSDQRTDQNAPPPVPSNVPGFVPPFVECKKDFPETATVPVTNATCVSEGTCEEDVLSVMSAVSNPVTSKQEIINVEKTGPSMDGITATSPELSDNLAGDSFVTPTNDVIVDLNGAASETNENALQRVEALRVTSDFGQPMKEDLEKCHEQGILDVVELDRQERQENTESEIWSIPTDQAIGELEISTFQEDVTNVLPVGDTIMGETLLAGEEATSDDPPIAKGEEILAEEPTNLSEGVEVSQTDPVKSEAEEKPLDLSGAQEGSIPVDESKNPPPECGDVSSIPSSDSVSAFAVYKPLKSQETTTGQPSSPERQTSVEEKPVNKGVFTKLLEFVGVKKKDEPMVATSVFYDTPETVIEATESTDEIGHAAVDTGDVEGIADVLNAGDLSALGSSTESPKRSPSPRIDIPTVPTTRLIEATPPTSPEHKPPRRDSEALTVDNFIPETPPVVEKKTSVNIEHEILDSSLVQKEVDEIISKAKLIASDQVDEDPVYSNILVSTPSTSQEAAKPPIALCEDFEEIHVTPQNERGRPRESVSSKLAGQILKAIPPPRRRAISDSRQTKVEVTLEKSLRIVHEMPGSGSPSSSSASPHSSLTSPVEELSGPPPVPPRRRRSQQRQEPQPPPKRKPKK